MRARRFGDGDGRARRGAVSDIAVHGVGGLGGAGMRGGNQPGDVTRDRVRQINSAHDLEQRFQLGAVHLPGGRGQFAAPALGNDLVEHLGIHVVEQQAEQEPIQLGLGERISAFEFNRVLAGQHEERLRQHAGGAQERDGVLLHGFEHGGLRFGRGAVDFVGEQNVGEHRAGLKDQLALAGTGLLQDVRAENVAGHKVGRELDALEIELEDLADGADERGFAEAGQTFQQNMAARENADQHEPMNSGGRAGCGRAVRALGRPVGRRAEFPGFRISGIDGLDEARGDS